MNSAFKILHENDQFNSKISVLASQYFSTNEGSKIQYSKWDFYREKTS